MNILLGVTGSVATTLLEKMIEEMGKLGNVRVVATTKAQHFIDSMFWSSLKQEKKLYEDAHEWRWQIPHDPEYVGRHEPTARNNYKKGDSVLHIELRKWADVFVIAPCSANTLAKLSYGLSDNLLTSVARAWDFSKTMIVAPAMNTFMLSHPATIQHTQTLQEWGIKIVHPQTKTLACGDTGDGAMAEISTIYETIVEAVRLSKGLL